MTYVISEITQRNDTPLEVPFLHINNLCANGVIIGMAMQLIWMIINQVPTDIMIYKVFHCPEISRQTRSQDG